jgi:flagellar assembly factor FliW
MQFKLQRLGAQEVSIDPQSIITFPQGIQPFESQRYKLFHEEGKASVFWLQSLDDPELLFSLTDPDMLSLSYEVSLSDEEQKLLQISSGDELILAVILYKDAEAASRSLQVNTRAPIILNVTRRLGLQKLLQEFETAVSIRGS